ncbi:hypothetical protein Bca52824_012362 [Brassica carinata]|uniref:Uncharacterized protein n=1 Tax=Brassica carinata TaxID=52824 RepID=A0A8X8B0A5_BRACI|nr:hypothetical protein Bca52824_012362 [Brassica carinata]
MLENKDHNSDSDSDGAPEEFTLEQDRPREERESKTFGREDNATDIEEEEDELSTMKTLKLLQNKGFLSKQKNSSDSEEEEEAKEEHPRKKKLKSSGIETVIYKEIPPPECLKTGLDFLKKRKAQVPRSSSILKNSGQALRLVTGAASAKKQPQPQRK